MRMRVGDYRVIYRVDDVGREVTVVQIAHRRDVYRGRSFDERPPVGRRISHAIMSHAPHPRPDAFRIRVNSGETPGIPRSLF